jgi:predicted nucleic acid-binding protein
MFLVDTCVLINGFKEVSGAAQRIVRAMQAQDDGFLAITDFNLHELERRGEHQVVRKVKEAIASGKVPLYSIGVAPGDWTGEKAFERLIDPALVRLVEDPSDAVLIAAAEKFRAEGVITQDRHHLYTSKLWGYLEERHIKLFKPHEFAEEYLE